MVSLWCGALGGIRTHDLFLRREALYPLSYKRTSSSYSPIIERCNDRVLAFGGQALVPRERFELSRP